MFLSDFQWYRKWRGGRWSTVTGMFWGRRWIKLPDACVERVDEDWRPKPAAPDRPPPCRHGKQLGEYCYDCRLPQIEREFYYRSPRSG